MKWEEKTCGHTKKKKKNKKKQTVKPHYFKH
jgi:hypothetical protein